MTTRAVLLDALGTLVELEPPWAHLAVELGIPPDARVEAAVRAEMAYYREHAHEAADEASLADLRARCAEIVSRELGRQVDVPTLMVSIRFRAYPDAAPALAALRDRNLSLICVSNWDVSLRGVLDRCGLGTRLDAVVTSAEAGVAKPDPAIFRRALQLARCEPGEALHVGDTREEDLAGARTAGIPALLIDREQSEPAQQRPGSPAPREGQIASLTEIEDHLRP